jgi:hypothetical protein
MPRNPVPATESIRVEIDASNRRAVLALAEALGEIAADMWLDGRLEIPLTDDERREIVGT